MGLCLARSGSDRHGSPVESADPVHWQHDTFLVRWRKRELRADAFITFTLTSAGAIDHATM
ncbi:MAG: DUF3471 domain-containing protein [Gemmatimonadota bacterium]|nr:DUF3471 domain-containing protein [Gemmatimonadota bacterium]